MTKKGGWDPTGFGDVLRQLRTEAGLSQRELAEKVGCAQNTLAKTERGLQEPAWPLVLNICRALGVDCTVFSNPPTDEQPAKPKRGRPRKADASEGEPAKGKGATTKRTRKRKGDG